jgi:hypothetical protein
MDYKNFSIGNTGRTWTVAEYSEKMDGAPDRMELVDGKLFWSEEERLHLLAALLEQVGADQVVQIGPPEVWRRAVAKLR